MPRGRRSYYKPSTPVSCRIFWAPEFHRYAVKTPSFGDVFVQDLRLMMNDLTWNPEHKVWLIGETDLESCITIITQYNNGVPPEVDRRPEEYSAPTNGESTPAGNAALSMFKVGGYDTAKKVYSLLIKQYHPDFNPNDPTAHDKAVEITKSWKIIKQELGW